MTEESKSFFLARKSAEIITAISEIYRFPLEKATDIFYRSETAGLIEEGIADLHCRSAKYLAQCIMDEFVESNSSCRLGYETSF